MRLVSAGLPANRLAERLVQAVSVGRRRRIAIGERLVWAVVPGDDSQRGPSLPTAVVLPEHPDKHRPTNRSSSQLSESRRGPEVGVIGSWGPRVGADHIRSVEVGEHEDVDQLGAGSGPRDHLGLRTCPPDPYEPPRGDIFAAAGAKSWLSSIT
jgi:hypothetical protein